MALPDDQRGAVSQTERRIFARLREIIWPLACAETVCSAGTPGVLIGILAFLDGVIGDGSLDEWTTSKIAERLVRHGLLTADHNRTDVHQALDDLNQRLRYAVGDYDSPPSSIV